MSRQRPTIAVFFGGNADSYGLSHQTGNWVCQYIPRSKFNVAPIHITAEGMWQVPLGHLPQTGNVDIAIERLLQAIPALHPQQAIQRLIQRPIAAMMTVLRGKGGDDGMLHGVGEMLDIPMVGSSRQTSQQTSHKQHCFTAVDNITLTPYSRHFSSATPPAEILDEIETYFEAPFFLKPVNQEGSVGMEEITSMADVSKALQRVQRHGDVMAQQRVPGQEIAVTLYENSRGQIEHLPVTFIVPQKASYYDALAKQRPGRVVLHTPTSQDNPVIIQAQTIAEDVYRSLHCQGMVTVDFIAGDHTLDLLEVNTIPTFSETTPILHQLRGSNTSLAQVLETSINNTLNRA